MTVSRSRRAGIARRRRRRVARAANDLTDQQWASLQAAWGGCAYCGGTAKVLQRDCVLPISRGGRYTLDNVVPACGSCNASKGNDEVTGWLRRKGLDEGRFLVRQWQISGSLVGGDDPGGDVAGDELLDHLVDAAVRDQPEG